MTHATLFHDHLIHVRDHVIHVHGHDHGKSGHDFQPHHWARCEHGPRENPENIQPIYGRPIHDP